MSDSDHNFAGGWAAVKSSMKISKREGFFKSTKTLFRMNQPGGFDCPGCAWPDPKNPSLAEFCENGVKALNYETTKKRATRALFMDKTVTELMSWDDFSLEDKGRLTEPFSYNAETDKYEAISWDAAFELMATEFKALPTADDAFFYTSGRTSNEAAFLYQLFGRMYGTNNFPDCSNMCHESSGVAMAETIGIGKGTVQLDDFEEADAIYVFGQNPGTNHPRMVGDLQKAAQRGCKIVSFNPLKEAGLSGFIHPQDPKGMLMNKATPISTHYYQVQVGGDMAAVRAMIRYILEQDEQCGGILDREFIAEHCHGFDDFCEQVMQEDWDFMIQQSGLTKDEIVEAAEVYINAKKVICCWAMGLTQQKHGVATIQEVMSLLFLKGNIGREGAGACPVRGHSNVQGDRTVGINEHPSEEFLASLDKVFNIQSPRKHGKSVVHAIRSMYDEPGKVFFAMGGNFASATPDTELTWKALQKCRLTVHVSTHLNRSHLLTGDKALILPCLARSESDMQASGPQSVTVEDSMSMVHASTGRNLPASRGLKSEPAIVAGLAKAILGSDLVDWDALMGDYSLIRNKIEEVLPAFKDYNKGIQQKGGFHLRNSAAEREWNTKTGKANFVANILPEMSVKAGRLKLMTLRSHDQYNTTIYDYNDRYRGIKGERMVLFMNVDDMKGRSLTESDRVLVKSYAKDGKVREATGFRPVAYDIPRGCVSAYFPEANVLVGLDEIAEKSHTPMSKFIEVDLERL